MSPLTSAKSYAFRNHDAVPERGYSPNVLGFLPETEVEFRVEGNAVRLVKVGSKKGSSRGRSAVSRLRRSADIKMSTDEILALTRK